MDNKIAKYQVINESTRKIYQAGNIAELVLNAYTATGNVINGIIPNGYMPTFSLKVTGNVRISNNQYLGYFEIDTAGNLDAYYSTSYGGNLVRVPSGGELYVNTCWVI